MFSHSADWKHLFLSLRNVSFDGKKSLSVDHTEFIMVWTQRMRLVGEIGRAHV